MNDSDGDSAVVGEADSVEVAAAAGAPRDVTATPPEFGEIPIAFPERNPGELDDSTELLLMNQYEQPDGTVTVQVLGWKREGEVVTVDYALPTGERLTDRYRWPTAGQYADSDFLDVVRGLGYTPATAEHVAGEFARARNENGRWRLVTGRRSDGTAGSSTGGTPTGGTPTEDRRRHAGIGGWTAARLPEGFKTALARYDPMDVATGAVMLLFAAVAIPAVVGAVTAGPSTLVSGFGATLFVLGVATLWLAVVAASGP